MKAKSSTRYMMKKFENSDGGRDIDVSSFYKKSVEGEHNSNLLGNGVILALYKRAVKRSAKTM